MESSSSYTFGRRFKNRLFVGGLPANTTAQELAFFFSNFAAVVEAKIIFDENQISKGYGFITFHSEQDVKKVTQMGTLFFRNKKLNMGPAVRKEGPSSDAVRPELVVVQQQMKGDYYYPLFSQEQCSFQYPVQYSAIPSCASLEVPYQLADQWTIPYSQPLQRVIYGFQPQVQNEYKPRKTRTPPRFRKGRTNNKSTERAI